MPENKDSSRRNKSDYGMQYPYNKTWVTESGMEIHVDDTPGKERLRLAHKDGSFVEISAGGKKIEHIVGDEQKYNKSGVTETIDHNKDSKVEGHSRVLGGGGTHSETTGDHGQVFGGHWTIVVGGNARIAAAGDVHVKSGGDGNFNIGGSLNAQVAGDMTFNVGGSTHMQSSGDTIIKAANIKLNP